MRHLLIILILLTFSELSMSNTVYGSADLKLALTAEEAKKLTVILAKFSKDSEVEKYVQTGIGFSGESFSFYDPIKKGAVRIEGSAALPVDDENEMMGAFSHWLELLTEVRNTLGRGDWHVHMDDYDVNWDSKLNAYRM